MPDLLVSHAACCTPMSALRRCSCLRERCIDSSGPTLYTPAALNMKSAENCSSTLPVSVSIVPCKQQTRVLTAVS